MSDHATVAEPFLRFQDLLAEARAVDRAVLPEPTAFSLGTVGADGQPACGSCCSRASTSAASCSTPTTRAARGASCSRTRAPRMCFYWQPLERQVRVEGAVEPVSDEEADAYFAQRARGSQLGAWASVQSRADHRAGASSSERVARGGGALRRRAGAAPAALVRLPASCRTHRVLARLPSRLHERHLYLREATGWRRRDAVPVATSVIFSRHGDSDDRVLHPLAADAGWSIDEARALYNIEGWGAGFFDIDEQGHVVVRPDRNTRSAS